jgi:diaminopimelate epimerase
MHGLGNDFIVLNGIEQPAELSAAQIRALSDRHFGIGFDQLLRVESPSQTGVDFRYRIFNADGEEVEHCGNGARCFAHYVREQGLTDKDRIAVETSNGVIELIVRSDGWVTVDMGPPYLEPERIPLLAPQRAAAYPITIDGHDYAFGAVSVGNPHAVLRVDSVATAAVAELGPKIQAHAGFPRGVNVGFMEIVGPDRFRLRVFERGVGETLACGTGACAAMVIGGLQGWLQPEAHAELRGGELRLQWSGEGKPVMMTGPATRVFEGEIDL